MVGSRGLEPRPVGLQPTALPVRLTTHITVAYPESNGLEVMALRNPVSPQLFSVTFNLSSDIFERLALPKSHRVEVLSCDSYGFDNPDRKLGENMLG